MTAGTRQYSTADSALTAMAGTVDLTVGGATDKHKWYDPDGAVRNLDLHVSGDQTHGELEITIYNGGVATEVITIRDGENSDATVATIDGTEHARCIWNGVRWIGTSNTPT